jgi:hypothetical protein
VKKLVPYDKRLFRTKAVRSLFIVFTCVLKFLR